MKKEDLINAVAGKLGTTKKDARATLEGVFETVEEALVAGEDIPMGDLGKLKTVKRAARKGRNPQDGSEIDIAAKTAPKFTFSKHLKELVK